jgi:hypothetical protein
LEVLGWGMGLIDAGSKGWPERPPDRRRRWVVGGAAGRVVGEVGWAVPAGGNWWRQTGWGRGGGGEERAVQAMPAM